MAAKKKPRERDDPFENMIPPQDYDFMANVDKDEFARTLNVLNSPSSSPQPFLPGVDIDFVCGRKSAPEKPLPHSEQILEQTDRQTPYPTPTQTPKQIPSQAAYQAPKQEDRHVDGHPISHEDDQLNRPTLKQTGKQTPKPWVYAQSDLTEAQCSILEYLISLPEPRTKYRDIQAVTGIKYGTIRGSMYALKDKGFLASTGFLREGDFRGIQVELTAKAFNYSQTSRQTPKQVDRHLSSQTPSTKVVVSSALAQEKLPLRRMTWEDFEKLCPTLLGEGYSKTNFDIVFGKWEILIANGYKLTWDQLVESYRRAEWDAENNEHIESAVAQTFAVMQRGPYGKPKGYVDPITQALKERVAEIEEAKKLQEYIDHSDCEEWWKNLPGEEKGKIISELVKINKAYQMLPPRSQGDLRFGYWLENIKE